MENNLMLVRRMMMGALGATPTVQGLEYESGSYSPTSDIARPSISFTNSHSSRPFFILIQDVTTNSSATTNSGLAWSIISYYDAFNSTVTNGTTTYYGRTVYLYVSSSGISVSGTNQTSESGTSTSAIEYHMSASSFTPYFGSSTRNFRSGRTYNWIAVWK